LPSPFWIGCGLGGFWRLGNHQNKFRVVRKLKEPNTKDGPFEDVVKSVQEAAMLVLVF
jgi:hypothetical protein